MMKRSILFRTHLCAVVLGISVYAMCASVWAAATSLKEKVPKSEVAANKNSTNMNFDDLLIQGKYHFSDETVITVEQDKALDALLGVRKDFKDRLKQSANRD